MMYVALRSGCAQAGLLGEPGTRLLVAPRYRVARLVRAPQADVIEI
jgi:hypothetical protein